MCYEATVFMCEENEHDFLDSQRLSIVMQNMQPEHATNISTELDIIMS